MRPRHRAVEVVQIERDVVRFRHSSQISQIALRQRFCAVKLTHQFHYLESVLDCKINHCAQWLVVLYE